MKSIITLVSLCFMVSSIVAQGDLKIDLKNDVKPAVYIDGKKYDGDIIDLLDQSKIESMNVVKGEQAIKDYNAPNGVILITTKKAGQASFNFNSNGNKVTLSGKVTGDNTKDPVIIIDGKVATKAALEKLSPDDIESVNVFKGQKAIDEYKAPNGAIVVKTKN